MHPARHRIKRQVIEVQVAEHSAARPVQDEVSRLYHQRIVPLIEQCCTAVSAPGLLDRIDRLELDLGVIDAQQLETELLDRLRTALPAALAAQIQAQRQGKSSQPDPQTAAHLELLTHFVATGSLPWWADLRQPQPVAAAIIQLLEAAPAALRQWLQPLVLDTPRCQRLILHLADEQLLALAMLLTPALQPALAQELPLLLTTLTDMAAQAGRARAGFRVGVWRHLLAVAAVVEESAPRLVAFYEALLRRCARDLVLPYATLLAQLTARVAPGQTAAQLVLIESLTLLTQTRLVGAPPEPDAALDSATLDPLDQEQSWQRAAVVDAPGEMQPLDPVLHQATAMAQHPLTSTSLTPDELTEPINRLQSALTPAKDALPTPPLAVSQLRPQPAPSPSGNANQESRATDGFSARIRRAPFAELLAERLLDAAVDEVYIDNAGLVILWPFLGHFFARLGLLAEQRFRDPAAQQRAVGLLHYVVSGEDVFPEYRLPLNKLLCGLELDALFDPGESLTPAEQEESHDLLQAVIAQAPILREISPAGLQGSFLLRPGVLRSRDGAWLLQVARESYDLVLDRFPWQWQWVQLPWMAAPLRVEW